MRDFLRITSICESESWKVLCFWSSALWSVYLPSQHNYFCSTFLSSEMNNRLLSGLDPVLNGREDVHKLHTPHVYGKTWVLKKRRRWENIKYKHAVKCVRALTSSGRGIDNFEFAGGSVSWTGLKASQKFIISVLGIDLDIFYNRSSDIYEYYILVILISETYFFFQL